MIPVTTLEEVLGIISLGLKVRATHETKMNQVKTLARRHGDLELLFPIQANNGAYPCTAEDMPRRTDCACFRLRKRFFDRTHNHHTIPRCFAAIKTCISSSGKVSSRSHTVFTVTVVQRDPYTDETMTGTRMKVGTLPRNLFAINLYFFVRYCVSGLSFVLFLEETRCGCENPRKRGGSHPPIVPPRTRASSERFLYCLLLTVS